MKYAVAPYYHGHKTSSYIFHCDECWYETTRMRFAEYTLDEARKICKQMTKHYKYIFDIEDENGDVVENINFLTKKVTRKKKEEDSPKQVVLTTTKKKSPFKIKMKR